MNTFWQKILWVTGINSRAYDSPDGYERPDGGVNIANQLGSTKMLTPAAYRDPNRMDNMWMYVETGNLKGEAAQGKISYKADTTVLNIGADHMFDTGQGSIRLGGLANISHISSSSHSQQTGSDVDGSVNGYAIGTYAQWQAKKDDSLSPYVDTIASFGWFDNEVKTKGNPKDSYNSTAWAATVRGGYPFALTNSLTLEPQLQFTYIDGKTDNYIDFSGTRVSTDMSGNFVSRLGIVLKKSDNEAFNPYIGINAWYDSSHVSVAYQNRSSHMSHESEKVGIIGDIRAGFRSKLGKDWLIWGEAGYLKGKNHYQEAKGSLGVSYSF